MQESLSPEHGRELVTDTLEQGLDANRGKRQSREISPAQCAHELQWYARGRVGNEGSRHLETSGRDVTGSSISANVPDRQAGPNRTHQWAI